MTQRRYVVVPRWREFQHYEKRRPPWIKLYVRLLDDDNYRTLTAHQRAVLHGLWLMYARKGCEVLDKCSIISSQLGLRVTRPTLDRLEQAGFIEFALAPCKQDAPPETETETEIKPPEQAFALDVERAGLEDLSLGNQETLEELAARLGEVPPMVGEGRLFEVLTDMDKHSPAVLRAYLNKLPYRAIEETRAEILRVAPRSPVRYAVGILRKRLDQTTRRSA